MEIGLDTVIALCALVLSAVAFFKSWQSGTLQDRVNKLEEQLKLRELEQRQHEDKARSTAKVEAHAMGLSNKNYRLRISNTGGAPAYNVRYEVGDDQYSSLFLHNKEPYEVLEPRCSYDEIVLKVLGFPPKFTIVTIWEDGDGKEHRREQIRSY